MDTTVSKCLKGGIPAGPIYDLAQVSRDPHIADDREMFIKQSHPKAGTITVTGSPLKFSDTPVQYRTPAPSLGQYNEVVYSSILGLDKKRIGELARKKII